MWKEGCPTLHAKPLAIAEKGQSAKCCAPYAESTRNERRPVLLKKDQKYSNPHIGNQKGLIKGIDQWEKRRADSGIIW